MVTREESEVGSFSVSCLFRCVEDDFKWVFTGVYGPVVNSERRDFLDKMVNVAFRWEMPWCVGGDFNVVRFPEEKGGKRGCSSAMKAFNEVINELQLVDLPLLGGSVTWSNGMSASRIDRFLVNSEWEDHFVGSIQS